MLRVGLCGLLVSSVRVPPHARVNSQCYPVWNTQGDNLEVVWKGATYTQPWVFNSEVNEDSCSLSTCVQRFWCTDSGAIGWYGQEGTTTSGHHVPLTYTWLENQTIHRTLPLIERSESATSPHTFDQTSLYGPGTIVVAGDTLFFYTWSSENSVTNAFPQLSALSFSPYDGETDARDLVRWVVRAYNVLGYSGCLHWGNYWSPLYASSENTVTLSIEDFQNDEWAIDSLVRLHSGFSQRVALIHYSSTDTPSVTSAAREVMTVSGYTCRAFASGQASRCYRIETGLYTWSDAPLDLLSRSFQPLSDGFDLPSDLWLMDAENYMDDVFRALVNFGSAPVIALVGDELVSVARRNDTECPTGSALVLLTIDTRNMEVRSSEPLHCEVPQTLPLVNAYEPVYGATTVKWAWPWLGNTTLLVAESIASHEYHVVGSAPAAVPESQGEHHIALGASVDYVQIETEGDPISCPVSPSSIPAAIDELPPTDLDLASAAESARRGRISCLKELLSSGRVDARASHDGVPLIVNSRTAEVALLLAENGADLEAKSSNGSTALISVVRAHKDPKPLLDAGVAVCTYPQNVFDQKHLSRAIGRRAAQLLKEGARKKPCEPGYYVGPGEKCAGLTICPSGSFCPGYRAATNFAFPCPRNTYNPHEGSQSEQNCLPCPSDRPYSALGSSDVSNCKSTYTEVAERYFSERFAAIFTESK